MSSEGDAKKEAKRPQRSESPAPAGKEEKEGEASAAPVAAEAKAVPKPKAAPRRQVVEDDPMCTGTCVMLVIIVLCLIFFAIVGAAYLSIWPMSMVRPFFFASPYALTKDNWDGKVAGRTVFIKFYAPWCGHCKRIAPAWDQLSAEYSNHSYISVAEVDCTGSGKALCEEIGVQGFPTLKYGDPNNLLDYKGGRTFEDLQKFTADLKPTCSPNHQDTCSDEQKALIKEFEAMGAEARGAKIKEQEAEIEEINSKFKAFIETLNADYKASTAKKEEAVKEVKDSGLGMLKAVIAHEASAAKGGGAKAEADGAKAEL